MFKKIVLILCWLSLSLPAPITVVASEQVPPVFALLDRVEINYDQHALLVKIKHLQTTPLASTLIQNINPLAFDLPFVTNIELLTPYIDLGHSDWFLVSIDPSMPLIDAYQDLSQDPRILVLEPNVYYEPAVTFNDPNVSQQWYLQTINMQNAWQDLDSMGYNRPANDVIVAVIDTGIDVNHPDLINNLWVNPNEIANGLDSDGNGYVDDIYGINTFNRSQPLTDSSGHGTHVSGIIAATANNAQGIAGVAYQVKIMTIKASDQEGMLPSNAVIDGINYALRYGASVINMSFGSDVDVVALRDVLSAASNQTLLVSAAGNAGFSNRISGAGLLYPAAYPFVLGVMATQANARSDGSIKATFSNWDFDPNDGNAYEILAPGVSILSTGLNGTYDSRSGTSMAAPMVAAAAAMMRIKFNDRSLYNNSFIFNKIIQSSPVVLSHIQDGVSYRYPYLNIQEALKIQPTVFSVIPSRIQTNQNVSITINGSHFFPGVKVFINGMQVQNVSRLSTQTIRFDYTANQTGLLQVRIENGDATAITTTIEAFTLSSGQLSITFEAIGEGATLSATSNQVAINSGTVVANGSNIVVSATIEQGYRLYQWKVNDVVVDETSAQLRLNQVTQQTSITVEAVMVGDVNHDNTVTITDIVLLSRHLAGLDSLSAKSLFSADINWDGQTSITDLVLLSRTLAGLE